MGQIFADIVLSNPRQNLISSWEGRGGFRLGVSYSGGTANRPKLKPDGRLGYEAWEFERMKTEADAWSM